MIGRFEVNYQVTEVLDENIGHPAHSRVGELWRASANVLVPDIRTGVVGIAVAENRQNAIAAAVMTALFKLPEDWPAKGGS